MTLSSISSGIADSSLQIHLFRSSVEQGWITYTWLFRFPIKNNLVPLNLGNNCPGKISYTQSILVLTTWEVVQYAVTRYQCCSFVPVMDANPQSFFCSNLLWSSLHFIYSYRRKVSECKAMTKHTRLWTMENEMVICWIHKNFQLPHNGNFANICCH